MRTLISVAALAALTLAAPATAQELSRQQSLSVDRATAPDADPRGGFAGSGYVLSASSDSSSVAISLGRSWESGGFGVNNLSLKFSAPLDKSTGEGDFFAPGGLSKSTAVEIGYTRVVAPSAPLPGDSRARIAVIQDARAKCKAALAADRQAACEAMTYSALEEAGYVPADVRKLYADEAFLNGRVWTFGFTASVGHDEFDYRDPADFTSSSVQRTPYAASASFGLLPKRAFHYLGAGLEFKQEYAAAKARTLCQAPPATGPQECVTASFARPERERTFDAFAVSRWRAELPVAGGLPLGIELKGAYDFEKEVFGLGGSIYLVGDDKGALRGGLRAGWQSDDDDPDTQDDNFTIGVFVGAPFSLF